MHDSGLRIDIDIWACMSARYSPFSLSVHISSPPPLARTPLGPKQLCNQIVAVEAESSRCRVKHRINGADSDSLVDAPRPSGRQGNREDALAAEWRENDAPECIPVPPTHWPHSMTGMRREREGRPCILYFQEELD